MWVFKKENNEYENRNNGYVEKRIMGRRMLKQMRGYFVGQFLPVFHIL